MFTNVQWNQDILKKQNTTSVTYMWRLDFLAWAQRHIYVSVCKIAYLECYKHILQKLII